MYFVVHAEMPTKQFCKGQLSKYLHLEYLGKWTLQITFFNWYFAKLTTLPTLEKENQSPFGNLRMVWHKAAQTCKKIRFFAVEQAFSSFSYKKEDNTIVQ